MRPFCRVAIRTTCIILLATFSGVAQDNSPKEQNGKAKAKAKNSVMDRFRQRKGRASKTLVQDYVPCIFDGEEEFNLRDRPSPFRKPTDPITEMEAKQIKDSLHRKADDAQSAHFFRSQDLENQAFKDVWKDFNDAMLQEDIAGLTPDDAVKELKKLLTDPGGKLLATLQAAKTEIIAAGAKPLREAATTKMKSTVSSVFSEAISPTSRKGTGPITTVEAKKIKDALSAKANESSPATKSGSQALMQGWSALIDEVPKAVLGTSPSDAEQRVEQRITDQNGPVLPAIESGATTDAKTPAENAIDEIVDAISSSISVVIQQTLAPTLESFNRPDDVTCSFSLLNWQEASDVFGRRVANQYVGIQVNIRNLNAENEFLIHDIQIAVDTGISMRQFGRFRAGRDKLIVRAVAERGKSEDRRNLVLNTLQMVGNIAGGASEAFSKVEGNTGSDAAERLATAVTIFQGPFITGFINLFPDHTLDHIKHIDDLTFSASSTSKTVVPTKGSVPLVTFLSEKPLEQMPFSRCGTAIKSLLLRGKVRVGYYEDKNTDSGDDVSTADPGSPKYPFCNLEPDFNEETDKPDQGFYTKPLHYKKWHSAALEILARRVYVVIAGVHIQEVSNDSVVHNIKCDAANGNEVVDLSKKDKDGMITCTLNGNHLERVASIKLGDTGKTGEFKASSDGNSATIKFKADDFNGVTKDIELFLVDTSGNQIDSKQSLKFAVRTPNITAVVYKPTQIDSGQALTATIRGDNLDRLKTIVLQADGKDPLPAKLPDQMPTTADHEMTVSWTQDQMTTLRKDKATSLDKPLPLHLEFKTLDDDTSKHTVGSDSTVTK